MIGEGCPFESPSCKYFDGVGCFTDRHHVFYPRTDYRSPVEKSFRNLPENVVDLPRCEHDELHATEEPPLKPSLEVMREAVNASRLQRLEREYERVS